MLPKHDNAGRLYKHGKYRAFHERMVRRFGGWTRKGQRKGHGYVPCYACPMVPQVSGISIDGNRLHFEFFGDDRMATITAEELQRRIAKQLAAGL